MNDLPFQNVIDPLCLDNIVAAIDEVRRISVNIDISKSSCIRYANTKIYRDLITTVPDKLLSLSKWELFLVYGRYKC